MASRQVSCDASVFGQSLLISRSDDDRSKRNCSVESLSAHRRRPRWQRARRRRLRHRPRDDRRCVDLARHDAGTAGPLCRGLSHRERRDQAASRALPHLRPHEGRQRAGGDRCIREDRVARLHRKPQGRLVRVQPGNGPRPAEPERVAAKSRAGFAGRQVEARHHANPAKHRGAGGWPDQAGRWRVLGFAGLSRRASYRRGGAADLPRRQWSFAAFPQRDPAPDFRQQSRLAR